MNRFGCCVVPQNLRKCIREIDGFCVRETELLKICLPNGLGNSSSDA